MPGPIGAILPILSLALFFTLSKSHPSPSSRARRVGSPPDTLVRPPSPAILPMMPLGLFCILSNFHPVLLIPRSPGGITTPGAWFREPWLAHESAQDRCSGSWHSHGSESDLRGQVAILLT